MSKRKAPTKTSRSGESLQKTKKATTKKATPSATPTKKAKPATTKKETAKKAAPKKETAKKATTKKETVKKETVKKETVKKATPKKETVKKETVKKVAPKKETAKKETVKKAAAPKKETVKKETAQKATTKKATTKKATTKKATTKKATTKKETKVTTAKTATKRQAPEKKGTAKKEAPKTTNKKGAAEKKTTEKKNTTKRAKTTSAKKPTSKKTAAVKTPTKAEPEATPKKRRATHKKAVRVVRAKPEFKGMWPEASQLAQGILLSFGSGDMAQLGLGLSEAMRERKFPTVLKSLQNVVAVSAGALHNAAITNAGLVYTWGCNDDGALGREGDEWLPSPVELDKAVKVCCGSSHSLALTSEGTVYAWGTYRNAQGVMGVIGNPQWGTRKEGEDEEPRKSSPTLQDVTEVVDIACGDSINLALTKTGEVFMWGDTGNDRRISGRLSGQRMTPHRVLFRAHGDVQPAAIKRIYAGGYSSFAVDVAGVVWGWGPNNYCQIGVESDGESLWVHAPKPLSILASSPVVHLAAALHHTICVNEKGEVFTFGRGSSGRLGQGDENDRKVPTLVADLSGRGEDKVINVACGEAHSCCVTAKGELFTFGNGDLNQLGNGEEGDVLKPYHVQGQQLVVAKRQVLAAGCGSQHTVIFTTAGDASAIQKAAVDKPVIAVEPASAAPASAAATTSATPAPAAPDTTSATPASAPATTSAAPVTTSAVPVAAPTPVESAMDVDTPRGTTELPPWPHTAPAVAPADLGDEVALPDEDELPEPSAADIAAIS